VFQPLRQDEDAVRVSRMGGLDELTVRHIQKDLDTQQILPREPRSGSRAS